MAEPVAFIASVLDGARRLRRAGRMAFPLYLANLAVALFAVLPLYVALHRVTAVRPAAQRLLSSWDLEILAEIVLDHPALLAQLQAVILFAPLAYLLLSQALLGGALGALARPTRPTAGSFGADALGQFLPLVGVLAWSVLPFGLAAALLYFGYTLSEDQMWLTRALAMTPGLALWALTDAALDFGRVRRILDGDRPALGCLVAGFLVVLRRPLASLGLHLGFGALGLAPYALLLLVPDVLDAGGAPFVLAAFLLRQLVIFSRVALRLFSLGAHLAFVQGPLPSSLNTPQPTP